MENVSISTDCRGQRSPQQILERARAAAAVVSKDQGWLSALIEAFLLCLSAKRADFPMMIRCFAAARDERVRFEYVVLHGWFGLRRRRRRPEPSGGENCCAITSRRRGATDLDRALSLSFSHAGLCDVDAAAGAATAAAAAVQVKRQTLTCDDNFLSNSPPARARTRRRRLRSSSCPRLFTSAAAAAAAEKANASTEILETTASSHSDKDKYLDEEAERARQRPISRTEKGFPKQNARGTKLAPGFAEQLRCLELRAVLRCTLGVSSSAPSLSRRRQRDDVVIDNGKIRDTDYTDGNSRFQRRIRKGQNGKSKFMADRNVAVNLL